MGERCCLFHIGRKAGLPWRRDSIPSFQINASPSNTRPLSAKQTWNDPVVWRYSVLWQSNPLQQTNHSASSLDHHAVSTASGILDATGLPPALRIPGNVLVGRCPCFGLSDFWSIQQFCLRYVKLSSARNPIIDRVDNFYHTNKWSQTQKYWHVSSFLDLDDLYPIIITVPSVVNDQNFVKWPTCLLMSANPLIVLTPEIQFWITLTQNTTSTIICWLSSVHADRSSSSQNSKLHDNCEESFRGKVFPASSEVTNLICKIVPYASNPRHRLLCCGPFVWLSYVKEVKLLGISPELTRTWSMLGDISRRGRMFMGNKRRAPSSGQLGLQKCTFLHPSSHETEQMTLSHIFPSEGTRLTTNNPFLFLSKDQPTLPVFAIPSADLPFCGKWRSARPSNRQRNFAWGSFMESLGYKVAYRRTWVVLGKLSFRMHKQQGRIWVASTLISFFLVSFGWQTVRALSTSTVHVSVEQSEPPRHSTNLTDAVQWDNYTLFVNNQRIFL